MLAINFRIEFELGTKFRNQTRFSVKDKVHKMPRIELACHIRKVPAIHLLDLLDFGALFLKFSLESIDNVFHGVLSALGIKHEQGFVTVIHNSGFLLNRFIAERTPLSITHFTASPARPIIFSTAGRSSSKNRPRT